MLLLNSLSLLQLLEKPGSDLYGKPSVAISKLKILYTSCRNTTANQRNGPEILQQVGTPVDNGNIIIIGCLEIEFDFFLLLLNYTHRTSKDLPYKFE